MPYLRFYKLVDRLMRNRGTWSFVFQADRDLLGTLCAGGMPNRPPLQTRVLQLGGFGQMTMLSRSMGF